MSTFHRQRAVAIKYNPDESAPKVTAKGVGVVAEKIMERGRESDVTIHQDAQLVHDLTRLDIGEHIPPDLYEVVAQVLVFISNLDEREYVKGSGVRGRTI